MNNGSSALLPTPTATGGLGGTGGIIPTHSVLLPDTQIPEMQCKLMDGTLPSFLAIWMCCFLVKPASKDNGCDDP
jgi:hypothetical protein